VVTVGINKAANAAIYAMKILANEYDDLKIKIRKHKKTQYDLVLRESEELKKFGLAKFVKKRI
jgi:5-(carboxyamino)imidazole ribonucleotide mutase